MTTVNPACPPIPTSDELLNPQDFIEVNVDELVPNETVVLSLANGLVIQCMEIVDVNNPVGTIIFRIDDKQQLWQQPKNEFALAQARFYRRVNQRKNYDDIAKKMKVRIRNYPADQELTPGEIILANEGLRGNIGNFLGPPTSGKGGRRKRAGTRRRRTRRNKRKGTRRIGRKYKR